MNSRLRSAAVFLFIGEVGAIFSGSSFFEDPCCTTTEATTTPDPCTTTTTNGYQAMGWQTDDDGNVFVGDDNSKFYLIQISPQKNWAPIPKDWPEANIFGSQYPDSPLYRGDPHCGCDCMRAKRRN